MAHRVTLIPGDWIGPEVIGAARRAVEATGVRVDWDVQDMGVAAAERAGGPLPDATLGSIRASRSALKGPIETPPSLGLRSANLALRGALDLFANVRPCRTLPGVPTVYDHVDLIVIRENTEGMYTGYEFEMGTPEVAELIGFVERTTGRSVRHDSGISVKAITEHGSERIARFAFDHAKAFARSKVTAGHKANIMKFSDGLFLEVVRRVAAEHPEIVFEDRIIDALCMRLVQAPDRFDVLVLPNLYGDIVAELGAGLIGGVGLAPGAHFGGRDELEIGVFEPTHGTAARLAGTDRANPVGAILSGSMLLRFLGEQDASDRLEAAVAATVAAGEVTDDIAHDGTRALGTRAFADAVIARL